MVGDRYNPHIFVLLVVPIVDPVGNPKLRYNPIVDESCILAENPVARVPVATMLALTQSTTSDPAVTIGVTVAAVVAALLATLNLALFSTIRLPLLGWYPRTYVTLDTILGELVSAVIEAP